jgi:hypothetical protein
MARYLRKLSSKARWESATTSPLRSGDDVPADLLNDLRTEQNALSVWKVLEDGSNLLDIVAAFATIAERFDKFDYAVFDESQIHGTGLILNQSAGDTGFHTANTLWHADVEQLSGKGLIQLALLLLTSAPARFSKKEVETALTQCIRLGKLSINDLKAPHFRTTVQELLAKQG